MIFRISVRSCPAIFLSLVLLVSGIAAGAEEQKQKPPKEEKITADDVVPATAGNLRGHRMLYNEGWYVVTSSSRALEFARERSIVSSAAAIRRAASRASTHSAEYAGSLKGDARDSAETAKNIIASGTRQSGRILEATHEAAKGEFAYAGETFKKAADAFVLGNLAIARRTEDDRRELAALPGDYFKNVKSDFSNLYDLAAAARQRFAGKIDPAWEESFRRASGEFRSEYERSGKEQNSLLALGPVLYGYLKSFYYGLAAPASKSIVKTTAVGTSSLVFLPVSATMIVAGRTVQSVGLTVYYTGKTGIKIVSPTIEGGLLSGLSLLSFGSVPVTYAAGGAVGAVNQVAFTAAGPAAGAGEAAGSTALHSAAYVGLVGYDAATGTTRVVINQASSGIVLGYNALTAVPAHALMGVLDGAILLGYDGPRLVIASARGRFGQGKDPASGEGHSLGDLPAGTAVDIGKLEQTEGVKVEVISTDPAVIRDVLEKIPADARGEHENR